MGDAIVSILGSMGDPGGVGLAALAGLGLFLCFLGQRYTKVSTGVAGFVLGVELAGQLSLAQGWSRVATAVLGLLGGAALATLCVVFVFLGVFGLGAVLAASLVSLAARPAALGPLPLILAALVGGFGALLLRQPVVIASTALYGGLMAIASLFMLFKGRDVRAAVGAMTRQAHVDDAALFLLCVTVLVTGGLIVQFRFGKGATPEAK